MTLSEFAKKYERGVDYDGCYGKQCVDYVNQYAKEVLEIKDAFYGQGIRYAYQVFSDFEKLPRVKENFTRIANNTKTLNYPEAGDVVVWSKERNGYAGHIAVVLRADAHSLTVAEQNYDGKGSVRSYTYPNYNFVLGWLRPKNFKKNKPTIKARQVLTLKKRAKLYYYDNSKSGVVPLSAFSNFDGEAVLKVGATLQADKVKTKANGNVWVYAEKYKGWVCVYDLKNDVSKL